MPPTQAERHEILQALSRDVKTSKDVNLGELAQPCYTEHFTGADLKALLYNAQLQAAHAVLDQRRHRTESTSSSHPPLPSPDASPDVSSLRGAGGRAPMAFRYVDSEVVQEPVSDDVEMKVLSIKPFSSLYLSTLFVFPRFHYWGPEFRDSARPP